MSPVPPSPRRGEVYLLDLSPATGHEMGGLHPRVIVQNDVGNQHSAVTIVAAVTTNLRVASRPVGVLIKAGVAGMQLDSVIHCGHLYTVDKSRLGRCIGQLPAAMMIQVERAMATSLALP